MQKWNFALLLFLGSLAGCGPCPDEASPVNIKYQESLQFSSYSASALDKEAAPSANFGIASYFTITCIDNRGPNAADFTFDVAKVYSPISGTQRDTPVTSNIPAGPPALNWKHPALIASTYLVRKGTFKSFTEPYPFVVIWSSGNVGEEAGVQHQLRYDGTPGQSVLMFNSTQGEVAYRRVVSAVDFHTPPAPTSCP